MKKLEILIRPEKLEDVKEGLSNIGVYGMTVTNVSGCGLQRGKTTLYRGQELEIDLLPKIKIEIVLSSEKVEKVIDLICDTARTGEIGDGKIFVYDIEKAVRIRTWERNENAL